VPEEEPPVADEPPVLLEEPPVLDAPAPPSGVPLPLVSSLLHAETSAAMDTKSVDA